MAIEFTAIRMSPGGTRHEHIEYLWFTSSSNSGSNTREYFVDWVDKGGVAYVEGRTRAYVKVIKPSRGDWYLQTEADGELTNNLLELPRK